MKDRLYFNQSHKNIIHLKITAQSAIYLAHTPSIQMEQWVTDKSQKLIPLQVTNTVKALKSEKKTPKPLRWVIIVFPVIDRYEENKTK